MATTTKDGGVTVHVSGLELPPNATAAILVLENLSLHAMTSGESETLYNLLQDTVVAIEEKWAEWDN